MTVSATFSRDFDKIMLVFVLALLAKPTTPPPKTAEAQAEKPANDPAHRVPRPPNPLLATMRRLMDAQERDNRLDGFDIFRDDSDDQWWRIRPHAPKDVAAWQYTRHLDDSESTGRNAWNDMLQHLLPTPYVEDTGVVRRKLDGPQWVLNRRAPAAVRPTVQQLGNSAESRARNVWRPVWPSTPDWEHLEMANRAFFLGPEDRSNSQRRGSGASHERFLRPDLSRWIPRENTLGNAPDSPSNMVPWIGSGRMPYEANAGWNPGLVPYPGSLSGRRPGFGWLTREGLNSDSNARDSTNFLPDELPRPVSPDWMDRNKKGESAPVRESVKRKMDGKEEENSRVFHDDNEKRADDDDDDHPELIVDRSE